MSPDAASTPRAGSATHCAACGAPIAQRRRRQTTPLL